MTKLEKVKTKIWESEKNEKCVKKMFLMIFGTKMNFWMPNLIFESLPRHRSIKIRAVSNMVSTW